jgi:hypothetical protein
MEGWISFFKVLSVLAAGLFGVLGHAKKPKDDAGRLTKWGKIALAGILLSTILSLTLHIFETALAQEAARTAKEEATKAKAAADAMAENLAQVLLNAKKNLEDTSKIKLNLDETLLKQDKNLKKADMLAKDMTSNLEKLDVVGGDVRRSLNPIGPVRLTLSLRVPAAPIKAYRTRLRNKYSSDQFGQMSLLDEDLPRANRDELNAHNFLKVIIVSVNVLEKDYPLYGESRQPKNPLFKKHLVFRLTNITKNRNTQSKSEYDIDLGYSYQQDEFVIGMRTENFQDYYSSSQFRSYDDFDEKVLELVIKTSFQLPFRVDQVEISIPNLRRAIITDFRQDRGYFRARIPRGAFSE